MYMYVNYTMLCYVMLCCAMFYIFLGSLLSSRQESPTASYTSQIGCSIAISNSSRAKLNSLSFPTKPSLFHPVFPILRRALSHCQPEAHSFCVMLNCSLMFTPQIQSPVKFCCL